MLSYGIIKRNNGLRSFVGETEMAKQTGPSTDDEVEPTSSASNPDSGKTKLLGDLELYETAVVSSKELKRHLPSVESLRDEIHAKGEREIVLVIRSMIERVHIPKDTRLVLGRSHTQTRFMPDVDLTAYGAADRGVSREHAQLWMEDEKIFIQDLNSTNGTFVNQQQLEPNTPTEIVSGDELLLGRLGIQLLFR
jgi:hypothetical protein